MLKRYIHVSLPIEPRSVARVHEALRFNSDADAGCGKGGLLDFEMKFSAISDRTQALTAIFEAATGQAGPVPLGIEPEPRWALIGWAST